MAIGESRSIRRSTTAVPDVRVGLLTDLVASLDKIGAKETLVDKAKAAETTDRFAPTVDRVAPTTDRFAAKTDDRFAVKDLAATEDLLNSYRERFEPGYRKSVGSGGLTFALRDYADNG